MARGKTPHYYRRDRAKDLPDLMHALRVAHKNVLVARGHLLAHQRAEDEAAERAVEAGATGRELRDVLGRQWRPRQVARRQVRL